MRRGEIAGLRWGDWNAGLHQLSISRTRQALAGQSTEFATKTRTSRRCLELDANTEHVLECWRDRQRNDGHHIGTRDSMFTNTGGKPLHPESISQLFGRIVACSGLPHIRFHDLRHTHASLLVAAGIPVKVVSERLGHAHPSFTIHLPTPAPRHERRSRPPIRGPDQTGRRQTPAPDHVTPGHRPCGPRAADVTSTGPVDEPGRRHSSPK